MWQKLWINPQIEPTYTGYTLLLTSPDGIFYRIEKSFLPPGPSVDELKEIADAEIFNIENQVLIED
jgi:hypothetical protein